MKTLMVITAVTGSLLLIPMNNVVISASPVMERVIEVDPVALQKQLGGSNIDDGEVGWMDYPNVLNKGEKHLPTKISFYQGPEYKKKWNKCRLNPETDTVL